VPLSPYCTSSTPVCDGDRWICVDDCPCGDMLPPPCPQPPPGCGWTGP
jgi:hypothetical protein